MKNIFHYLVLALFALQVSSCSSCDKNNRFPDPVRDCGCPNSTYLCANDSCYCPQGSVNGGDNCWPLVSGVLYNNVEGCIYNGEVGITARPSSSPDDNNGSMGWNINANPGGGVTVATGAGFSGWCKYIVRPEGDSIYNDIIPTMILKAGIYYKPVVHGHFSVNKDTLFAIFNWHRVNQNGTLGSRTCRHGANFIKHR